MLHGACRQHLAQEQRAQPARAFADHAAESDLHVRLVDGLHAAEFLNVFGAFRQDRVDHVVHGHDADHQPVFHHRHGQQVVFGNELGCFFAVGQRRNGKRTGFGCGREHIGLRLRRDQAAQAHRLQQRVPDGIEHIDRINRLAAALHAAHMIERLRHGPIRGHADEFGRHDRGGTAFRICLLYTSRCV